MCPLWGSSPSDPMLTCRGKKFISRDGGGGGGVKYFGIVPFVTSHLKGRFFVFFTVGFLIFLAPAEALNLRGQLPNPVGQSPNANPI